MEWQDIHRRRLTTFGSVSTLAGQTTAGPTDATGTNAQFNYPSGVAVSSGDTYVYVADHGNSLLRRVDISSQVVVTVAGSSPGFTDAIGTNAQFQNPVHIAMHPGFGYMLMADRDNRRIRKILTSNYDVTTIAGDGTQAINDAVGTNAHFDAPSGIAITPNGVYALVSEVNACVIRRITLADNTVTTIAGQASSCAYANGAGTNAQFSGPEGITAMLDSTNFLLADIYNHVIRVVDTSGNVATYCGPSAPTVSSGSNNDVCASATFFQPFSVTLSPDGSSVAVADKFNYRVRHIDTGTLEVTTLAGAGGSGTTDGDLTSAQFNFPHQLAYLSNSMDIVVGDATNNRIRMIDVYHSPSQTPTSVPTGVPTSVPTSVPSSVPSFVPTQSPSSIPSSVPTQVPTSIPTTPTAVPTSVPTAVPTEAVAQHIFVHAVDLHGDGWGDNLFLGVAHNVTDTSHHRHLLEVDPSNLYSLNCACKVVRLFSNSGNMTIGMHRNVTSVNGTALTVVPYEWEALWAIGYSDGVSVEPFYIYGGVNSEVVIENWEVKSSLRMLDVSPKRCVVPPPPRAKPAPSKSSPSKSNDKSAAEASDKSAHNSTKDSSTDSTDDSTSSSANASTRGGSDTTLSSNSSDDTSRSSPKRGPKPPPPVSLELTLSQSNRRSWCDDSGDSHIFECSMENLLSDDALLPNSLTYPRYFISNAENLELMQSGTMIRNVKHEYNTVKLPPDGEFVLSVSGHNTEGGEISWDFCGMSGVLGECLHFRMRNGLCEPIDFMTKVTSHSCEGEWTTGMLLLSPIVPLAASAQLEKERMELNFATVLSAVLGVIAVVLLVMHFKGRKSGADNAAKKKKKKYIRLRPADTTSDIENTVDTF